MTLLNCGYCCYCRPLGFSRRIRRRPGTRASRPERPCDSTLRQRRLVHSFLLTEENARKRRHCYSVADSKPFDSWLFPFQAYRQAAAEQTTDRPIGPCSLPPFLPPSLPLSPFPLSPDSTPGNEVMSTARGRHVKNTVFHVVCFVSVLACSPMFQCRRNVKIDLFLNRVAIT